MFFVQILLVLKVKPWSIRKIWLVSSLRALAGKFSDLGGLRFCLEKSL